MNLNIFRPNPTTIYNFKINNHDKMNNHDKIPLPVPNYLSPNNFVCSNDLEEIVYKINQYLDTYEILDYFFDEKTYVWDIYYTIDIITEKIKITIYKDYDINKYYIDFYSKTRTDMLISPLKIIFSNIQATIYEDPSYKKENITRLHSEDRYQEQIEHEETCVFSDEENENCVYQIKGFEYMKHEMFSATIKMKHSQKYIIEKIGFDYIMELYSQAKNRQNIIYVLDGIESISRNNIVNDYLMVPSLITTFLDRMCESEYDKLSMTRIYIKIIYNISNKESFIEIINGLSKEKIHELINKYSIVLTKSNIEIEHLKCIISILNNCLEN